MRSEKTDSQIKIGCVCIKEKFFHRATKVTIQFSMNNKIAINELRK